MILFGTSLPFNDAQSPFFLDVQYIIYAINNFTCNDNLTRGYDGYMWLPSRHLGMNHVNWKTSCRILIWIVGIIFKVFLIERLLEQIIHVKGIQCSPFNLNLALITGVNLKWHQYHPRISDFPAYHHLSVKCTWSKLTMAVIKTGSDVFTSNNTIINTILFTSFLFICRNLSCIDGVMIRKHRQ